MTGSSIDLSLMGFSIQVVGIICIALLFQLLHRALPRCYFQHWSRAWIVLAVALVALRLALMERPPAWPLEAVYYLGEYAFAVLLGFGFARYPGRGVEPSAWPRWSLGLAVIWSIGLTQLPGTFGVRFGVHALVFAVVLGWAWVQLLKVRLPDSHRWAYRLAIVSVALLALDFIANGVLMLAWRITGSEFAPGYSAYQSIIDLFVEVLVAFGLVAIAAVDMRSTLERAHAAMQGERDRMSMLAHQDALTGCFNRLALDELKPRLAQRRGCVAMVDMNRLKPLNDQHGHALGDLAICQVANALKASLRPHDHVFRIGGDEFVLVCFDMPVGLALQRLAGTEAALAQVRLFPGHDEGLAIAYGAIEFDGTASFEAALAAADASMYGNKRAARGG